ncbi:MAG: urease accessory protein UreE [Pseudomonadota bacterium]
MTGKPSDDPIFRTILGRAGEPAMAARLHDVSHRGEVDVVDIAPEDVARRRMHLNARSGRTYRLALPRDQRLEHGAVLQLGEDSAVVIHLQDGPKLRLTPADIGSALRLGYHCGNLHWAAQFDGGSIEIPLDGPEDSYRRRLEDAARYARFDIARIDP